MTDFTPEGYAPLAAVLDAALMQAAKGKGAERHGNGAIFTEQPMQLIARMVGLGFPLGQSDLTNCHENARKSRSARCWKHRRAPNRNGSRKDHVMAPKALPSPEVLRQLLRYEPETGKLFWLPRPRSHFKTDLSFCAWNARYPGSEAFTATSHGYKLGAVNGSNYRAHRIIWCMVHGFDPKEEIDHISGDPADNRISNLRVVTTLENMRNVKRPSNNKSGVIGVNWDKEKEKWHASIAVEGRQIFLGYFADLGLAAAARQGAERCLGFHPNHGRVGQ